MTNRDNDDIDTGQNVDASPSPPDGTSYVSKADYKKVSKSMWQDIGPVMKALADYDSMD